MATNQNKPTREDPLEVTDDLSHLGFPLTLPLIGTGRKQFVVDILKPVVELGLLDAAKVSANSPDFTHLIRCLSATA